MNTFIKSAINYLFVLTIVVVAGISMLQKHIETGGINKGKVQSDVLCYVDAARSMAAGQNIYFKPGTIERNSYTYPPFYAFVNIPITPLPDLVIDIVWYILNIFLLSIVIFLCYSIFTKRNLWQETTKEKWFYIGLSIILPIRYIIRNFQDANVNIVILFLIVLALYMYFNKSNVWWCALIGIAGAIKLFPLLLVVYFFAKKDYKAIFIAIGTFTLASILPVLLIGFTNYFAFISQFFQYAQKMFSPAGTMIENYSFWGTLTRLFSNNPSFAIGNNEYFLNFFNVNLYILKLFVYLLNVSILIYIYINSRKVNAHVKEFNRHAEWVIVLLLMHFTSVLIEEHHTVSFMVAYLYLLVGYRRITQYSKLLFSLVIFSGIFSIITAHDIMAPLIGKEYFNRLLAYSIPLLPVGLFLIGCLHYLSTRRSDNIVKEERIAVAD